MAVSSDACAVLSTYSLGSCIGVVAYDGAAMSGGILHVMLPDSSIAPERAAKQPSMFADTGIALFLRALGGLGAERERTRLFVAGGASVLAGHDPYKIGERNTRAVLALLGERGYEVGRTVVGGAVNRALHLEMSTGLVTLTTPTEGGQCSLAN